VVIGRYAYEESKRLAAAGEFYPLLMAAMRWADTDNTERLRDAFPAVWEELHDRYHAPGGVGCSLSGWRTKIQSDPADCPN
jgi:hypothetical protein